MCSFLYLSVSFYTVLKTLLSLINNLFIPVHLILRKLFEEQYLCILQIGEWTNTLNFILFWPLSMQVDIADGRNDVQ